MARRQYDYRPYFEQLELDFGEKDIKTRSQLRIAMKEYKYRIKRDKTTGEKYKAFPTDKQLSVAWDYLKEGKQVIEFPSFKYRTEGFKTRALDNLVIKGKKYRKGQYIPKQK